MSDLTLQRETKKSSTISTIKIKRMMANNNIRVWAFATMTALSICSIATSCSSDENTTITEQDRNWSTDGGLKAADNLLFEENVIGNGDKEFVFKGKQTLKRGTYTLKGWVYIAEGSELTIEPGTIIKGDKSTKSALIVERGGKLYARGTASAPIVFTSGEAKGERKPGDWGGVILCGKARNNQGEQQIEGGPRTKHGGTADNDNSGVLSYVRIEFAGYPFATDKEINGLTLGSVGSGTQIDHVQVSFSNDDSFEWFGGTVNCKYLVAYRGWDDDFDTDNGFSGCVQYGLVVRDPHIADKSQSNGFESDNCADGASISPFTTATFSNITFIGPKSVDGTFKNELGAGKIDGGEYFPNNGSGLGKYQSAMQIRRSSHLSVCNSLAVGYPIGIIIDGEKGNTQEYAKEGNLMLRNIVMADMDIIGSDANKIYEDVLYDAAGKQIIDANQQSYSTQYFLGQSGNSVSTSATLKLSGKQLTAGPGADFMPANGSSLLNGASFNELPSSLERVSYIGAFGTDNWLEGWTNFDPNNAEY